MHIRVNVERFVIYEHSNVREKREKINTLVKSGMQHDTDFNNWFQKIKKKVKTKLYNIEFKFQKKIFQ